MPSRGVGHRVAIARGGAGFKGVCAWRIGDGDRTEFGELAETGDAADEEAGVDRSGHPRAGGHGGDDRKAGHLAHVPRSQAAALLGHEDDSVRSPRPRVEHRVHGEVAGATENDVRLALGDGVVVAQATAVDHDDLGRDHCWGRHKRDGGRDGDGGSSVGPWDAEQRARGLVAGHERYLSASGGVQRDGGSDGRGSLTAPRPGDHDRPNIRPLHSLVTGDQAEIRMRCNGRRGDGWASPTQPITPSGLLAAGHLCTGGASANVA
ncbi:MAG: hypothetical protein V7636_84 [Actinomycetota bacterium]